MVILPTQIFEGCHWVALTVNKSWRKHRIEGHYRIVYKADLYQVKGPSRESLSPATCAISNGGRHPPKRLNVAMG